MEWECSYWFHQYTCDFKVLQILSLIYSKEGLQKILNDSFFLKQNPEVPMNYKINILEAVLCFGYYHWIDLDFKKHLHFFITDIFHSAEKKKGLIYFKKH